jgi:Ca2+-binding RTX toxin-like protein
MATVNGTNSANWLVGTSGADQINGYGGNDILQGGAGADRLDGGIGYDTAFYTDSTVGVRIDLAARSGRYGTAEGDQLYSIENVYGSVYGDSIYGDIAPNAFYGLDGEDGLKGYGGADLLDGGYGDDWLQGGFGADTLNGGEGSDAASYLDSPAAVFVSLLDRIAQGGYAQGDTLNSIENVIGSDYTDLVYGDNGANVLEGGYGDDTLKGFGGADRLYGDGGNNYLVGMDGDDQLVGGDGRDMLDGGRGTDHLVGWSGTDTFVFSSIEDLGLTQATADWILDVNAAEGDRIEIASIDADVYTPGDQAFTFIGTAPFSGTPGEIRYVLVGEVGLQEIYFELQTGTSTDIEGMIHVGVSLTAPDASWFYL